MVPWLSLSLQYTVTALRRFVGKRGVTLVLASVALTATKIEACSNTDVVGAVHDDAT